MGTRRSPGNRNEETTSSSLPVALLPLSFGRKKRALPRAPAALLQHLMDTNFTRHTLCTSYVFQSVHRSSKFWSVHNGQLSLFPLVPLD
ncbi:hypothetical protein MRB53_002036 [Persea americana]|uniref:Uncharacterized protein n=1 Tax=Persea americana TaxID=3435 RepID=A0ACC2MTP7_PERAE|nr:hypothetical protein MRB53_002036 [Persea americana]